MPCHLVANYSSHARPMQFSQRALLILYAVWRDKAAPPTIIKENRIAVLEGTYGLSPTGHSLLATGPHEWLASASAHVRTLIPCPCTGASQAASLSLALGKPQASRGCWVSHEPCVSASRATSRTPVLTALFAEQACSQSCSHARSYICMCAHVCIKVPFSPGCQPRNVGDPLLQSNLLLK